MLYNSPKNSRRRTPKNVTSNIQSNNDFKLKNVIHVMNNDLEIPLDIIHNCFKSAGYKMSTDWYEYASRRRTSTSTKTNSMNASIKNEIREEIRKQSELSRAELKMISQQVNAMEKKLMTALAQQNGLHINMKKNTQTQNMKLSKIKSSLRTISNMMKGTMHIIYTLIKMFWHMRTLCILVAMILSWSSHHNHAYTPNFVMQYKDGSVHKTFNAFQPFVKTISHKILTSAGYTIDFKRNNTQVLLNGATAGVAGWAVPHVAKVIVTDKTFLASTIVMALGYNWFEDMYLRDPEYIFKMFEELSDKITQLGVDTVKKKAKETVEDAHAYTCSVIKDWSKNSRGPMKMAYSAVLKGVGCESTKLLLSGNSYNEPTFELLG